MSVACMSSLLVNSQIHCAPSLQMWQSVHNTSHQQDKSGLRSRYHGHRKKGGKSRKITQHPRSATSVTREYLLLSHPSRAHPPVVEHTTPSFPIPFLLIYLLLLLRAAAAHHFPHSPRPPSSPHFHLTHQPSFCLQQGAWFGALVPITFRAATQDLRPQAIFCYYSCC